MPFVDPKYPSLALPMLNAILKEKFGKRVDCTIHYLYHDFAVFTGVQFYSFILNELNSGAGEWFFSTLAFPGSLDNSEHYFHHYYPGQDDNTARIRQLIRGKRNQLGDIFHQILSFHGLDKADLVGFSSIFFQNTASLAMARLLKEQNREIITVIGGANVEYPMGNTLLAHTGYIDYVFSGPALQSFPEMVSCYLAGDVTGLNKVKGLFSRESVKAQELPPESNNCYGMHIDINHLLPLDYDSFLASYENHFHDRSSKPFLFFNTSRGCYWGEKSPCTFCAQAGSRGNTMAFSHMTAENVRKTIDSLGRYKGRVKVLYATDSILARDYPDKVFAGYKSAIPLLFEMNVHHLDARQIRMLSQAGVRATEAGIESLHSESLRLMRKGTTASRNLQFMMDCLLNDIYVAWNFLLGFPGEHEGIYEQIYNTIPLLTHFPPAEPTAVDFERYSEYHRHPEQFGLHLIPYKFYFFTYPFPEPAVYNLAYHFENTNPAAYKKGINKWIPGILEQCRRWKALWNMNEGIFPCLYMASDKNQTVVIDTRTGKEKQYRLTPAACALLEILRTPRTKKWLAAHGKQGEFEQELKNLLAKGLVFCDEQRYFNIVFPSKPHMPGFFSLD